jgi:hypothetical protein
MVTDRHHRIFWICFWKEQIQILTHGWRVIRQCRHSHLGKPAHHQAEDLKKGGDKQMAYLLATIETLFKKGLKKAMKGKKRKRNHAYDASSSDSDSE